MKMQRAICSLIIMLLFFIGSATSSFAQDQDSFDLRKTRIARISYLEGEANVQHLNQSEWDATAINVPVFVGDLLYTGNTARLELETFHGFLRLSEKTTLEVRDYSYEVAHLDLTAGSLTITLLENRPGNIEVATPQAAISIKKAGVYRIKVLDNGDTEVAVRKGEAEVSGRASHFKLREDRQVTFSGENDQDVRIVNHVRTDIDDIWNEERNQQLLAVNNSYGYLNNSTQLYGVSALDSNGQWLYVPGYGSVWQPWNTFSGWSPYQNGHWAFYQTLGWTWISFDSWGWLPYHYGFWAFDAQYNGWFWVPFATNWWYWSPAQVTWYQTTWNHCNYIAWQPRVPSNWTGNNGNVVPGNVGPVIVNNNVTPVHRDGKGRPQYIDPNGAPLGMVVIEADQLVKGGRTAPKTITPQVIQSLNDNSEIIVNNVPKPKRTGLDLAGGANRQLPTPSIVSRPVLTVNKAEAQDDSRRKHQVIAPVSPSHTVVRDTHTKPVVTTNNSEQKNVNDNGGKSVNPSNNSTTVTNSDNNSNTSGNTTNGTNTTSPSKGQPRNIANPDRVEKAKPAEKQVQPDNKPVQRETPTVEKPVVRTPDQPTVRKGKGND